ncbi:MAG: tetratricopeptide repeat protein [Candidatus Neomarinimicrobiota bacterium]
MKKFTKIIPALVIIVALLHLTGCGGTEATIPITTSSEEALADFNAGRVLSDNLRNVEAHEFFLQATEKDPRFALAFMYAAISSTYPAEGQRYLRRAVELAPQVSDGERMLILSFQAGLDDDTQRQVVLREKLVAKYSKDKRAHWFLGLAYNGTDRADEAMAEYKKSIRLDRNFAPVYNQLGYLYFNQDEHKQAEKAFEKYIELIPDEPNPYDSMADLYTNMGMLEKAIEFYNKALERNPNFTTSLQKVGLNQVFLRRFEEARDSFRRVYELEQTNAGRITAVFLLGRSYMYEGRYPEVMKAFDDALSMAYEFSIPVWIIQLHLMQWIIHWHLNELDEADAMMATIETDRDTYDFSINLQNNIANVLPVLKTLMAISRNDLDAAQGIIDDFKAGLAEDDDDGLEAYHTIQAEVSYNRGDFAEAISHAEQGDSDNAMLLYHRALAHRELNQIEEARKDLEQLVNWNKDTALHPLVWDEALAALNNLD